MEIKRIPFDKIVFPAANGVARNAPDPKYKRDWEEFQSLKRTLSYQALLNIPTVRPEGDKYCVTDGNRRLRAMKELWAEQVPSFVKMYPDGAVNLQVAEMSEADSLAAQISGNAQVNKQSASSLATAVRKYILLRPEEPFAEVAKKCGYSEARLTELLKVALLPEEIQELNRRGDIKTGNALQLTKLPIELVQENEWVEKAITMPANEFAAEVGKAVIAYGKAIRSGNEASGRAKEFSPQAKLLKKDELGELLEKARYAYEEHPTEYNLGCKETMEKVFSLDEISVAKQKEQFDKQLEEAEERKRQRKAKREAKKLEEAQRFIEENSGEIIN